MAMTTPEPASPAPGGVTAPDGAGAPLIDVRGLRYRYPGAGTEALAGLTLTVARR